MHLRYHLDRYLRARSDTAAVKNAWMELGTRSVTAMMTALNCQAPCPPVPARLRIGPEEGDGLVVTVGDGPKRFLPPWVST